MNDFRFLIVGFVLAGILLAGAASSFDRAKAAHSHDSAIFFTPELPRSDVTAVDGYKYVRPNYGHQYSNRVDLSLTTGQHACESYVTCIKQWQFVVPGKFHGLGVPIRQFQIDQAPQLLCDYHETIGGYSR